VVVGATLRLEELRRGETIPRRVIAAQIAPCERRGPLTRFSPWQRQETSSTDRITGRAADQAASNRRRI
jgi:hypothetical protein